MAKAYNNHTASEYSMPGQSSGHLCSGAENKEVQDIKENDTELTVLIPCLDEAETLGECINTAVSTLKEHNIKGEVLVADNGSQDNSAELAVASGARVVHVQNKGYGNALIGGIKNARGKYIIMGDADGSYDFAEIPRFLAELKKGYSLVQGCRLPAGGGTVKPGAMPLLHKWIGNPVFSYLARLLFKAPVNDINCGIRGFTKELFTKIDQRCTGMEFAVEMVLKASLFGEPITEVPVTLHPDKRISNKPHLRTFRDGWRTLRFYLMISPRWLFLYPGILMLACGLAGYALSWSGFSIANAHLGVNTVLISSMAIMVGYQLITFAALTKIFAIMEGILPYDNHISRYFKVFTLERGLICSLLAIISGTLLIANAFKHWWLSGFGSLPADITLYFTAPGVLLLILGIQTVFSSFVFSMLGMKRL